MPYPSSQGVVMFDPAEFVGMYPPFATVAPTALQMNFDLATLILNNSPKSRIASVLVRKPILYLLTAHMTQLLNGKNGEQPSDVVGRISDASEGSVSVSAEWASQVSANAAWFLQTQYGATAWQMMAQFRTMQYFAAPTPCYGPPDFRRRPGGGNPGVY